MAKSVTIYSTPYCVFCKMAKEFFKKNNVKYKEIDVSSDEKGLQHMVDISKQMAVPVITIDKEIMVGFNESKLKKTLGIR